MGTLYGPLAGALLIIPLEFQLRATLGGAIPGANLLILGGLLVLFALFMRRGVIGAGEALWRRVRGARHD